MSARTVSPRELHQKVQSGEEIQLIDVRTPVEFQEMHAQIARNVPLDQLDASAFVNSEKTGPVYVICRSGGRGNQAAEKLTTAGLTEVYNVEGGTLAWDQSGLPVNRGKKMISLERQVRIAAGLLVVIGSVLGAFVHPYWIGLAGFVGAGLVFAGVTDTCGMGLMLAKMPWNKVKSSSDGVTAAGQSSSSGTRPTCCS
ncbi:rhodanese-like domain-containing protein [Rubinisphaera margarita]|uniref:rhodanese-like domain-containing protein n=1 Tax=Rubinisphaera margarita TaxID=2909586 RepID=UPI001EE8BD38|nr:rhodanese-like domain-containing protein [Rubinisphaera margarita]MCG6156546.1 rhodanese-like domain-containing protein [Rubinisphaera margarita]